VTGERLAQDPLAVTGAVDIGGVEERDSQFERAAQRGRRFRVVGLSPADWCAGGAIGELAADRPAAESNRTDL
jgi:hypothetical protein